MLDQDPTITADEIDAIVAAFRADCDWASEVTLARTGSHFEHHGNVPDNADALVLETRAWGMREALAANEITEASDTIQNLATRVGILITHGTIDERLAGRAILKEYIRSCEQDAAEAGERVAYLYPDLSGEFGEALAEPSSTAAAQSFVVEHGADDPAGAPADPIVVLAPAGETIMELYEKFKNEKEGTANADTWDQNRKIVKRFAEFIGDTSHVTAITRKTVRDWKQALMKWPRKASDIKEFKGLSFCTIIEANEVVKKQTICPKTMNKYLSAVSPFTAWLLTNEYIPNEVMSGMFLSIDDEQVVFPYTQAELERIFASPLFGKCAGDGLEHLEGEIEIRDWRYWIPLIALFSGARLGEICQLGTADIREVHGAWIFHITEEDTQRDKSNKKSTKTGGSQRVVPIHNEGLIIRDFLAYHAMMVGRGLRTEQRRHRRSVERHWLSVRSRTISAFPHRPTAEKRKQGKNR